MSKLVEKAKAKAKEVAKVQAAEKKDKENNRTSLEKSLVKLTKEVTAGLREFHNVKCKEGTLKFIRRTYGKQIATLKLVRPTKSAMVDVELLQIDASVESGYRDYSDDCRNIPYTEASVRVSTPEDPTDSYGNRRINYGLQGLGLNGFYESVHNWDDEEVQDLLDKTAEWLSPLFASK